MFEKYNYQRKSYGVSLGILVIFSTLQDKFTRNENSNPVCSIYTDIN